MLRLPRLYCAVFLICFIVMLLVKLKDRRNIIKLVVFIVFVVFFLIKSTLYISWSDQHPCSDVTAFSRTDFFLVHSSREFRPITCVHTYPWTSPEVCITIRANPKWRTAVRINCLIPSVI